MKKVDNSSELHFHHQSYMTSNRTSQSSLVSQSLVFEDQGRNMMRCMLRHERATVLGHETLLGIHSPLAKSHWAASRCGDVIGT